MKESSFSILKKERFLNAFAIMMSIFGVLVYFITNSQFGYELFPPTTAIMIPVIFILMGVFIFLLNYLKNGQVISTTTQDKLIKEELNLLRREIFKLDQSESSSGKLKEEIELLKNKVESLNFDSALISDEEKSNIISGIESHVKNDVNSTLLKNIEEKFSDEYKKELHLKNLRSQFEITRARLTDEIISLGRRGNVNLAIGVVTTIAAVGILASTVITGEATLKGEALLSYYLPRFTLSVFIEIFSFFFLKLYKSGLSEIKYFQNELTNAEFKFIATEKSIALGCKESTKSVIDELARTERNFKLTKGESTVELEKDKAERNSMNSVLDTVTKIVASKK